MKTTAFLACVTRSAEVMPSYQQALCALDMSIGDGDHGVTMARGFRALAQAVSQAGDASSYFLAASGAMLDSMGGAIGPIYGLFFEALAQAHVNGREVSAASLADGFSAAAARIAKLCGVQAGDKTVYDAMLPAAEALCACREASLEDALVQAVQAAQVGRDATKAMMAKKGRARFLMEKSIGPVDAGASSFVLWLEALQAAVMEENQ